MLSSNLATRYKHPAWLSSQVRTFSRNDFSWCSRWRNVLSVGSDQYTACLISRATLTALWFHFPHPSQTLTLSLPLCQFHWLQLFIFNILCAMCCIGVVHGHLSIIQWILVCLSLCACHDYLKIQVLCKLKIVPCIAHDPKTYSSACEVDWWAVLRLRNIYRPTKLHVLHHENVMQNPFFYQYDT